MTDKPTPDESTPRAAGSDFEATDRTFEAADGSSGKVESPAVAGPTGNPAGEHVSCREARLAAAAHLSGAAGPLLAIVGGVIGPWMIWLASRKQSDFVGEHAREAVNFQFTVIAATAVCVLSAVMTCGLTLPKLLIPVVMQVVFGILAAYHAVHGRRYRYPICLRLLKRHDAVNPSMR